MIQQQGSQTIFRIHDPDATEVYLAGDFNCWQIPGVAMANVGEGMWEAALEMPSGNQRVGYFAIRQQPAGSAEKPGETLIAIDGYWLPDYDCVHVDVATEPETKSAVCG